MSEDIQKVTAVKIQDTLDAETGHGIMNTAKAIWEINIETVQIRKGARTEGKTFEARE